MINRKPAILFAWLLALVLTIWSVVAGNMEFVIYAATAIFVVFLLDWGDRRNNFANWTIWAFDLWLLMHIFGGLYQVNGEALYSLILIPIVGEPYSILKYDQVVHTYCYFMMTPLLYQVLINHVGQGASQRTLVFFSVLAATGVGGLNEIVEFAATVLVPDVNVGGYENTAIDIVCNTLGALLSIPFLKGLRPGRLQAA